MKEKFVALALLGTTCLFAQTKAGTGQPSASKKAQVQTTSNKADDSGWQYATKKDEMTDEVRSLAAINSDDGEAAVTLVTDNGKTKISYQLVNSQFYCSEDYPCSVNIRVGEKPLIVLKGDLTTTGSTRLLWIEETSYLVHALRGAKTFKLQASEFSKGMVVHTFTSKAPLVWTVPSTPEKVPM